MFSCAFSPDGRFVIGGTGGGTVRMWDSASNQEFREFRFGDGSGAVSACMFTPDDSQVLAIRDKDVCLWDVSSTEVERTFTLNHTHDQWGDKCSISPDGKWLLESTDHADSIDVWELSSGRQIAAFPGVRCGAFSPDGQYICGAAAGGALKIWDVRTSREIRSLSDSNTLD